MGTMAEEMQSVRKKMEDYDKDLDVIKQKFAEGKRVLPPPCLELPPRNKGLANNGPPIVDTPASSSSEPAASGFLTAPSSPTEQ